MKWIVKLIISLGLSSTALAGSARDPKAHCGYESGQWDSETQCCNVNGEELFCGKTDRENSHAAGDSESKQSEEILTE
jgi:hypothetical protein